MTTIEDRIILKLDTILLRQQVLENMITDMNYTVQQQETKLMAEIDEMTAEIEAVKGIEDSAVATINRLADSVNTLVQNATDLVELKAAVAVQTQALKDNAQPLANAIAANP